MREFRNLFQQTKIKLVIVAIQISRQKSSQPSISTFGVRSDPDNHFFISNVIKSIVTSQNNL